MALAGVVAAIAGLIVLLALHLFEPTLAITWSFAHLGRTAGLRPTALVLVLLLPPLLAYAWSRPAFDRRPAPVSMRRAAIAFVLGWAVLARVAFTHDPASLTSDSYIYMKGLGEPGAPLARWHLSLWVEQRVVMLLRPTTPFVTACLVNTLFGTIALGAMLASARRLAATRGEALAVAALACSTFGILQIAVGYFEIYPAAVALMALYVWAGLASLDEPGLHPGWALTLGALAPMWYFGLALVAPSVLVVVVQAARRRDGVRRLAGGLAAAVLAAGFATLPVYGRPFAWLAFVADLARDSVYQFGYSPTSALLPWWYLASRQHAMEVLHTLVLVDGVGVLFLLTLGPGVAWGRAPDWDPRAVFLAAIVIPYFLYLATMDTVYGAFADYDLFTPGSVATALLGARAFVAWSRRHDRRLGGLVLGLALATAGVHLLARLNALHVDSALHMRESPAHVLPR